MSFELADVSKLYGEDPNLKKEDVNNLLTWLETQPHLPELTELQVILFLHSCYYQIEEARITIENYMTLRTSSDLFRSANEEMIRRVLATFFTGFLPRKTPEGYSVLLVDILDPRAEKYMCMEHAKVAIMAICLYFHQYGPANGLILVCDMKNASFGHLFRINVSSIRLLFQFLQEAAPTRIKGIHFINAVTVTKSFVALIKPFVKKEIYQIIKVHSHSFESFHDFIPKECLPEDYDGDLSPVLQLCDGNLQNFINYLEFFEWHDKQKVDESKRIDESKKKERLFWQHIIVFCKPEK